jgi:mycothiol synthase
MSGLRLRPYAGNQDIPGVVSVINAEWSHDGVSSRATVGEKVASYGEASPMFDAHRDVTVAELDGSVVGYAIRGWHDAADSNLREYRVDGAVVPGLRRRGFGRTILIESMRLARELAATHDTPRSRAFGSMSHEGQHADEALLRSEGFTPARYFYEMVRPTLDDVPEIELPSGLHTRSMGRDDAAAVFAADAEAFRDHWGGFDDSPAEIDRWMQRPEFNPDLWVIAFDGDEIAGGVILGIYPEENADLGVQRGWLDSVFTRRPWRGRGVARALIAQSLRRLREVGMNSAVLGVDAANPTGALGLYERAGFEVVERSTAWRKPFDL